MVGRKRRYILNYYDEDGEEQLIEVSAYSAEQAEFLSGKGNVIAVEEAVRIDRRARECFEN